MKKIVAATAVAAALAGGALAGASPANAADGGHSQAGEEHYWIKVPLGDTTTDAPTSYGFMGACNRAVHQAYACDAMVPLLAAQKSGAPGANGYWAEWYPNSGITRSGTW